MAQELSNKEKAAAAFKHSPTLEQVFVSPDGVVFISKNAAENQCRTQKLKKDKIEEFDRSKMKETAAPKKEAKPSLGDLKKEAGDLGMTITKKTKMQECIDFIAKAKESKAADNVDKQASDQAADDAEKAVDSKTDAAKKADDTEAGKAAE